jgi:hypothetical protein
MKGAVGRVGPVVLLACYLPVHVAISLVTCVLGWLTCIYAASGLFGVGL